MGRYASFVSSYPYVLVLIDLVVAGLTTVIVLNVYGFPGLAHPEQGYHTKGTQLSPSIHLGNLLGTLVRNGTLSVYPSSIRGDTNVSAGLEELPRFVITSNRDANLFTEASLKAICQQVDDMFQYANNKEECHIHSIPHDLARIKGKDCMDIKESDFAQLARDLKACKQYYFDGSLQRWHACHGSPNCTSVPLTCRNSIIFNVMHFYSDSSFLVESSDDLGKLSLTLVMLPDRCPETKTGFMKLFSNNEEMEISSSGNTRVAAAWIPRSMEYEPPDNQFESSMDALVILGIAIFLLYAAFSQSIVMPAILASTLIFSFFFALFLYHMVLRIESFPILNHTVVLMVFIMATTDTLVMDNIWKRKEQETVGISTEDITTETLYHCGTSISITNFVLIVGFLCGLISHIVSVKLFSIFSVCYILSHWFYTLTLTPAVYVIRDKCRRQYCSLDCYFSKQKLCKLKKIFDGKVDFFWGRMVPLSVTKIYIVWISVWTIISLGAIVVIFGIPVWQLSDNIQPHTKDMLQESYEAYHKMFRFEKEPRTTFQFVWGISVIEGSPFETRGRAEVAYIDDLNLMDEESRVYLEETCKMLSDSGLTASTPLTACSLILNILTELSKNCSTANSRSTCDINILSRQNDKTGDALEAQAILHNSQIVGFRILIPQKELIYSSEKESVYRIWLNLANEILSNIPINLGRGYFSEVAFDYFNYMDLKSDLVYTLWATAALCTCFCTTATMLATMNVLIALHVTLATALSCATAIGLLVLFDFIIGFAQSVILAPIIGLTFHFTINFGVAYMHAFPESREARVTEAIATIGSGIASALCLALLAGGLVAVCGPPGFGQFGIMIIIAVIFAWIYSQFFLMSLLRFLGPKDQQGDLLWFLWKQWNVTSLEHYNTSQVSVHSYSHSYTEDSPRNSRGNDDVLKNSYFDKEENGNGDIESQSGGSASDPNDSNSDDHVNERYVGQNDGNISSIFVRNIPITASNQDKTRHFQPIPDTDESELPRMEPNQVIDQIRQSSSSTSSGALQKDDLHKPSFKHLPPVKRSRGKWKGMHRQAHSVINDYTAKDNETLTVHKVTSSMKIRRSHWTSSSSRAKGGVLVFSRDSRRSSLPQAVFIRQSSGRNTDPTRKPPRLFKKSSKGGTGKQSKKYTRGDDIQWGWVDSDQEDEQIISRVARPIFMPSYMSRNSVRSSLPRTGGPNEWFATSNPDSQHTGSFRTSGGTGSVIKRANFGGGRVSFSKMGAQTLY